MALSRELCNDTPPFLVDRRRDPLLSRRQELLVEISVLALRDSLLDTLLEQAAAGLHACGGQRSLLLRRRNDEWPMMYAAGRWQTLQLGPGGDRALHQSLAGLAARLKDAGPDEHETALVELLAMPDDSNLLLLPLLADPTRLLVLGVFLTQIPDEDHHRFLRALSRVLAAAWSRQEAEIARRAELAHAGRLLLLGEMTSGLIHELNQPLAAIVNYAYGSQRQLEVAAPPPAVLRERLDKIAKQACRASELVKRLRRLIRKEPIRCVAVSLGRLLADVVGLCEADAEKQRLRLELRLPAEPLPEASGDPMQIEQVLLNMLYNAIEAGPHPALADGVVAVEAERFGPDRVLVRIRDQGPGLPDGDTERLFQSFHTTKPDGLGLGLAISRSLVESQDGRLWAENNDGHGATFNLALPIAKAGTDRS
jgi:signal transduction histidine kinase